MGFWLKDWFQRLQQIIKVELKDINILSNIHIGNKTNEKAQVYPDGKLEINPSSLTNEELGKITTSFA